MGRWKVDEHFNYIQAIKDNQNLEEVVYALRQTVPMRTACQVKAHHQKMINKYGGWQQIRDGYPNHN